MYKNNFSISHREYTLILIKNILIYFNFDNLNGEKLH